MHITKVVGFQQFVSSTLPGGVACSSSLMQHPQTGEFADAAVFSVGGSTGAVRFRDDGTAPTSNIGMRLPSGTLPYLYQGDLHKLRFVADSVPGNADLNITYVKASD